jgi:DNA-binding response OmpR family regulator
MGATPRESSAVLPDLPWSRMPARMRVLYITTPRRAGGWLTESFASDSASQVLLEEVVGMAAGLEWLRDEVFDAVLVSHEPEVLDALSLVEGFRAAGSDEPIIILGSQSEQELAALAFEVGADAYVCVHTATTRALIWTLSRAMEHQRLIRENKRLSHAQRHRLRQEHQETERLLDQQRALLHDLERLRQVRPAGSELVESQRLADSDGGPPSCPPVNCLPLPVELIAHYRELLRAYVIMGSGNLAEEMAELAELLATAGVTAHQTMQLHLHVLEELVRGLGSRSTRHVMSRADLLVLEVMVHLAECYRCRYVHRVDPPVQRLLPGFGTGR